MLQERRHRPEHRQSEAAYIGLQTALGAQDFVPVRRCPFPATQNLSENVTGERTEIEDINTPTPIISQPDSYEGTLRHSGRAAPDGSRNDGEGLEGQDSMQVEYDVAMGYMTKRYCILLWANPYMELTTKRI